MKRRHRVNRADEPTLADPACRFIFQVFLANKDVRSGVLGTLFRRFFVRYSSQGDWHCRKMHWTSAFLRCSWTPVRKAKAFRWLLIDRKVCVECARVRSFARCSSASLPRPNNWRRRAWLSATKPTSDVAHFRFSRVIKSLFVRGPPAW